MIIKYILKQKVQECYDTFKDTITNYLIIIYILNVQLVLIMMYNLICRLYKLYGLSIHDFPLT